MSQSNDVLPSQKECAAGLMRATVNRDRVPGSSLVNKTSKDLWASVTTHPDGCLGGGYEGVERRLKPRIHEPFFARVRGVDASGEAFEVNTLLDNISASGLYMRLARPVAPGTRLFIVIHLSALLPDEPMAGRTAVSGVVIRSEPRSGSLCGVAIKFTRYRFL